MTNTREPAGHLEAASTSFGRRRRFQIAGCVTLVALTLLAACSSSDSSDGSSSAASGNSNPFSKCSSSGGTGSTPSEACQKLSSCELAACDASYRKCYGDGFASGAFGGVCADYISCFAASCNPGSCASKLTSDCTTCNDELSKCEQAACTAERAACKGSGGAGGSGTGGSGAGGSGAKQPTQPNCVSLAACCAASSFPAQAKPSCDSLAGLDMDATCMTAVTEYQKAGLCPLAGTAWSRPRAGAAGRCAGGGHSLVG